MLNIATLPEYLDSLPKEDRDLLVVDEASLQEAFIVWPGAFAWLHARLAEADRVYQQAKLDAKRARATVFVRHSFPPAGIKKPSDELIKQLVEVDAAVCSADYEELRTQEARARIKGLCEAIGGQRDMLVQRGARERAEMTRAPQINQ